MADDCRISNALADFLIELSLKPVLYAQFHANQEEVIARPEHALSEEDKAALRTHRAAPIRYRLDNIQIQP